MKVHFFNIPALLVSLIIVHSPASATPRQQPKQIISYVDTSLAGAQKYVLRVNDKPYYMTNIQIRLDNMRYARNWSAEATEAVIAQAASDGFNTVSIPVHWREVEPEKDKFDWVVLEEYLRLVNKYDIKMEMLWFGTNSGGITQRLGVSGHLRTPDYVLYSPKADTLTGYGSYSPKHGRTETTSEYTIRRDVGDYSLDLADKSLRERETYVLGKVMAHIASWDKNNGSKHPIIGVQIGNEVVGYRNPYPNALIIDYLSDVASAVKNSDYVVWTRVNSIFQNIPGRIFENESRRSTRYGTNIDFVGIDTYRHHFKTDEEFVASMRDNLPYVGRNFRMIMETGSEIPNAAQLHLAALSGNSAFNYYDFSRIYDVSVDGIKPCVSHLEDIRLVNKVLNSCMTDIALNAHGYGLYVHNWEGVKSAPSTSPAGITFTPGYPTSQAISIVRSHTEIVLTSTKGGRFTLPDSLGIISASKGYFNSDNEWTSEGEVPLGKRSGDVSLSVESGITMRLVKRTNVSAVKPIIYQAEFACLSGGLEVKSSTHSIGFAGNGYVELPPTGGAAISWKDIDGVSGGDRTIIIRYSHGGSKPSKLMLAINGNIQFIELQPTGSWNRYRYFTVNSPLKSGTNNTIRLETAINVIRIDKAAYYETAGNIDELQVF